jgi:hypothetical protein
MPETILSLAAELTARDPMWSIYPAADGALILRAHGLTYSTRDHASIKDLLRAALAYKPIPVIPRQPCYLDRSAVTIRKSGSKWEAATPVGNFCNMKTKREAEAAVDRLEIRMRESRDWWFEQYAHTVAEGVEGVDYVYR